MFTDDYLNLTESKATFLQCIALENQTMDRSTTVNHDHL